MNENIKKTLSSSVPFSPSFFSAFSHQTGVSMILEIIYKKSAEKIITENDLPSARLRFEIAQFSVAEKSLFDGVVRFLLTIFYIVCCANS